MSENRIEKLLPFFVYILFDPNDFKPFYVGMGQNTRDLDHKAGENDPKEKKIKEIKSKGQKELRVIIGRYETREEALSVESTLINWVYGYDNLTNQNRAFGNIYIRPHSQLVDKHFPHLDRIDRPYQKNIGDGKYTKQKLSLIDDNKILDKLAVVKEIIINKFPSLIVSKEQILTPQDPCILIKGFSKFIQIQIRMTVASGKYFTFNYLPINLECRDAFIKTIQDKFPSQKIPKGNKFERYFPHRLDGETVKVHFEENYKCIKVLDNMLNYFNSSPG